MIIELTEYGGWTGYLQAAKSKGAASGVRYVLDTSSLDAGTRDKAERLAMACLAYASVEPASPTPDAMTYQLVIDVSGEVHTVTGSDPKPLELAELLPIVRQMGSKQP